MHVDKVSFNIFLRIILTMRFLGILNRDERIIEKYIYIYLCRWNRGEVSHKFVANTIQNLNFYFRHL